MQSDPLSAHQHLHGGDFLDDAGKPCPDGYDADWVTAAMFFENRGGIGNKSRGYIIKQSVVAVHAIVDAIVYGELMYVDPERWEEIPDRGGFIDTSDKWPDEWAE